MGREKMLAEKIIGFVHDIMDCTWVDYISNDFIHNIGDYMYVI